MSHKLYGLLGQLYSLSSKEIVADNLPNILDAVFEPNFLALFFTTTIVSNTDFVDSCFRPCNPSCNFCLKTKSLRLKVFTQPTNKFTIEHLVTRFHVS